MTFQDSAVPDLPSAISSLRRENSALPVELPNLEPTAVKSGQKWIVPFVQLKN